MGSREFRKLREGVSIHRTIDQHDSNEEEEEAEDRHHRKGRTDRSTIKSSSSSSSSAAAATSELTTRKKVFPRLSKHAPAETTSKKPVKRFRQVIETHTRTIRDPRFDKLSGKFNEGLFESSYGFINDYEKKEVELLRKQVVVEKDPEAVMEVYLKILFMSN